MRKYFEPITRGAYWVMAAIVLCQAAMLLMRKNPAASLEMPETFVALKAASAKTDSTETNSLSSKVEGTNASSKPARETKAPAATHQPSSQVQGTNAPAGTNASASLAQGTHAPPSQTGSTSASVTQLTAPSATSSTPSTMPPSMSMGMPMGGGMGPGKPLPPAAQAWVDRIKDTEVFGPVPRPMPMALLGIAGEDVFFRAPNGQTGVFRKGQEMGGVKLLATGNTRILVEQDGKKQELTIFSEPFSFWFRTA